MKGNTKRTSTPKGAAHAVSANHARGMSTPRLRFPEFQGRPGWEEKALKDLCEINSANDGLPDSFIYVDLESVAAGILTVRNRIDKDGAPSRAQRLLKNGDVVFQIVRPYQRNNLFVDFQDDEAYVASTGYAQLRAHDSEAFLFQVVHTDAFVNKVIAKCTGSSYPAINSSDLAQVSLHVPPSPVEQRKIAACLGSLDEWIGAEGRKLEALRSHKKGLMQQLFPRPGESRPRLRFPEFHNAGEWGTHSLGELCKFVRGPFGGALKKDIFVPEGYAVYEQSHAIDNQMLRFRYFITKDKYNEMKRFVVRPRDIIMSCSGTMGKFAQLPQNPVPGVINQALLKLTVSEKCSPEFILLMLELPSTQSKLLSQSAGGAIKNVVGVPQLKEIEVPLPTPAEQQRIAACLSSLDAVLSAQSRKVAGLKAHKKGLMQQLFPSGGGGGSGH